MGPFTVQNQTCRLWSAVRPMRVSPVLAANGMPVESVQRSEQPDCTRPARGEDLAITPQERAAYDAQNELMMKRYGKYPEMALVVRDPDAFIANVKARFEAQKAITPDDPYQFDFSDYGMPVLADMHDALKRKLEKVEHDAKAHDDGWHLLGGGRKAREFEVGQAFLRDLIDDVGAMRERGRISYRRLQEVSHFATNAMGYFDTVTPYERMVLPIDDYIEGHVGHTIEELHHQYRRNSGFTIFEGHALMPTVDSHGPPFERDIFDKKELKLINLPTMRPLGPSIFMRFLPYPVYFKGIGENPIPAEGFVREGGRFALHDDRHNSSIYDYRRAYIETNKLSEAQVAKLQKSMDLWHWEMDQAANTVQDKELRAAIALTTFSHHHDSGHPYVPSRYVTGMKNGTLWLTYAMKEMAGQKNGFSRPFTNLPNAEVWLREFWTRRYPSERAIIDARPKEAVR